MRYLFTLCFFLLVAVLIGCSSPTQTAEITEIIVVTVPATAGAAAAPPTVQPIPTESPAATPEPDLNTDLLAYYPFNGDAQDESGNDNHGVVNGPTLTADRFGNAESAYHFDGTDDYIEVPAGTGLNVTFRTTLSAWVLFEQQAESTWYSIIEKSDPERGGHSRYGLWLINGAAEACIEPVDGSPQRCIDGETLLVEGEWNHIAAVYDGETLRIYINGDPAGERTFPISGISTSSFELFMGTDLYNTPPVYLTGAIDDIRIYRRALAEDEIQALYLLEG